jgi:hypothetical protein
MAHGATDIWQLCVAFNDVVSSCVEGALRLESAVVIVPANNSEVCTWKMQDGE